MKKNTEHSAQYNDKSDTWQNEIQLKNDELSKSNIEREHLSYQLAKAISDLNNISCINEKLQVKIEQTRSNHVLETAALVKLAEELRNQIQTAEKNIKNQNKNITSLIKEHNIETCKLREQIATANERIADLLDSTSWRITAPIRKLGRFLSRIKGR